MKVAVISSSIRVGRTSHNTALEVVKRLNSEGEEAVLVDLMEYKIPPMEYHSADHPDLPATVSNLKSFLDSADAMVFVSPEYNGSYSPALKNALDYMPKSTFRRKVIGIASVSSGGGGGMRAALSLQQLVLALWGVAVPQMLLVPFSDQKWNESGDLVDLQFGLVIDNYIKEFLWLAKKVNS